MASFNEEDLLRHVAGGNWGKVIEIYKKYPESHVVKIPKTGDTALHAAISSWAGFAGEELVSHCRKEALAIRNDRGETPLHIAASVGSASVCQRIAKKDGNLIGLRNDDGETPPFVALSHGKLSAFRCLQESCGEQRQEYMYCKRNDGDTILHCAISQEYFEIAYDIIREYPKFKHMVNENGLTPLHILASKPSAFRSGAHLFGLSKLVYRRISVSEHTPLSSDARSSEDERSQDTNRYPKNWKTCITLLQSIRLLVRRCGQSRNCLQRRDVENQLSPSDARPSESSDEGHQSSAARPSESRDEGHQSSFPPNYITCIGAIKLALKALMPILYMLKKIPGVELALQALMVIFRGLNFIPGQEEIVKRTREKKKHIWSVRVLDLLLKSKSDYPQTQDGVLHGDVPDHYEDINRGPSVDPNTYKMELLQFETDQKRIVTETPVLIAAKNGVLEMVERILRNFPDAIFDVNTEKKNIAMLAVENRHLLLYNFLLYSDPKIFRNLFSQVDKDGNTVIHIAAAMPDRQPWNIRGAALQMHMEVKWYKFVKESLPRRFSVCLNREGKTSRQIFRGTHEKLIEDGRQWLTSNSSSCSVVAALIATVAFATSATIPGGVSQDKGTPTLEHRPIFIISAVASLIALCSSMISVIMFLAILTSSFKRKDFHYNLPRKLLLGLISLLVSIVSMFVSFFAGHYFVMKEELKHHATLVYALICLPLLLFIIAKFPLDSEIVWTILREKPKQCRK